MCEGKGCPKKETCYRFTATPDTYWQAWFTATPTTENEECPYYYPKPREEGENE